MAIALALPDFSSVRDKLIRLQFTTKRRIDFYRDMQNAFNAGIAPYQAVEQMRNVSKPRRSLRWLVSLLDPVIVSMKEGRSFAEALSEWVPSEDAALISTGEKTGNMTEALSSLITVLISKHQIESTLKSNLIYSGVLLVIILGILTYIMAQIVPLTKELIDPEDMLTLNVLPIYIGVGDFILTNGVWVVVGVLAMIAVIFGTLNRWRPDKIRAWLDSHIPPWSMFARLHTVFFMISCGSMMQSGRTFSSSVEQIRGFSSPWMRDYLNQILRRLSLGQDEVIAMQVDMVPTNVADRLNFYAILPDFTHVMKETARDAMEQLIQSVARAGGLMRALVLLFAMLFVAGTVFSMYEMAEAIEASSQKQMM